jgi:hypothetical protein
MFGGGGKRNRKLEALQQRQQQDAQNERSELEAEKAAVANISGRRRRGRGLLSYAAKGASSFGV